MVSNIRRTLGLLLTSSCPFPHYDSDPSSVWTAHRRSPESDSSSDATSVYLLRRDRSVNASGPACLGLCRETCHGSGPGLGICPGVILSVNHVSPCYFVSNRRRECAYSRSSVEVDGGGGCTGSAKVRALRCPIPCGRLLYACRHRL